MADCRTASRVSWIGVADDGRRASGRRGDELELRFQGGIFAVLGQQTVGVALNNGDDIIQFMNDGG